MPLNASVPSKVTDPKAVIENAPGPPMLATPPPKVDPNARDRLPLGPALKGKARRAKPEGSPGEWVTDYDYPASALRNYETGATEFGLAIATDGSVTDCVIIGSSGSAALDLTTCRLMKERGRFVPALDSRGRAVVDRYTSRIRWVIPDYEGPSDLQQMPPFPIGARLGDLDFVIEFSLAPDGTAEACNVIKGDSLSQKTKDKMCADAEARPMKAQLNDEERQKNIRRKVRMRVVIEVEPLP